MYWWQRFCAHWQFSLPPIQETCILCVPCGFVAKWFKGPCPWGLSRSDWGIRGACSNKKGSCQARRTFICFALSSGIPPQVVMKWTGHSDYQAMKPYIEIAEKTKADAMKLFEQEMEK